MAERVWMFEHQENDILRYNVYTRELQWLTDLRDLMNYTLCYQVPGVYVIDNLEDMKASMEVIEEHKKTGKPINELPRPLLSDGKAEYRGITDVKVINDIDKPSQIIITGRRVFEPELTKILTSFLNREKDSIQKLLDYQNNEERLPINKRIKYYQQHLYYWRYDTWLKNHSYDEILKDLKAAKEKGYYFDGRKLQGHYKEIGRCIEIEEICGSGAKGKKMSLNAYKKTFF